MTNKAIVPSIPGSVVGVLDPAVQNGVGVVYTIYLQKSDGSSYGDMTGYTISGVKTDTKGNTSSLTGTLAWSSSSGAIFTWTVAAADVGTSGEFRVFFTFVSGAISITARGIDWSVATHPAATVVAAPGVTGVSAAEAALLTVIAGLTGLVKMAGGVASAIRIKLDGTTAPGVNDDSGDGYGIGSIWIDTTNDNVYIATDVTVAAANWEQINGGGGGAVASVFGRTGAVVAAPNDYAASEIEDDVLLTASVGAALAQLDGQIAGLQSGKQDVDSDLTTIAALSPTNDDIIQRKAGAWTNRTMAQLLVDLSAKLNAINALTWAANSIIWLTGAATASVQALAAHVVTFIQSASAADARSAIGAGTGNGDLLAANNLSDVTASTARTNLAVPGLATANTFSAHNLFQITDAVTNATTIGITLEHQSSGTPATVFGSSIKFLLESTTTVARDAALIDARWATATDATRLAVLELSAYYTTTKTSLQIYPMTSGSYARIVWGSNADQGLWRENNEQVISGASVGFKSFNGSAYVFSARIDGDTTAGNTRLLIYDVDNAAIERVSVGAADSGGAGYKVLRIPN